MENKEKAKKRKITFELSQEQYEVAAKEAESVGLTLGVYSKVVLLEKIRQRDTVTAVKAAFADMTQQFATAIESADGGKK